MQAIGTKIQTLRRNKGLTQAQLAEVLSVSAQSVSKWENDLSVPDITLLPVIARFFGITMDELFGYRLDALNYKERFIRFMADNGVLRFGEFELKSGRISPYFIDTGRYRSAAQIFKLSEFYSECMRENNVESNLLVGSTHHEIPIMIAASMTLYSKYGIDINYSIDSAVGKQLDAGDRVTLIKDVLTSGGTLDAQLQTLPDSSDARITDVIVSVDRMERCGDRLESARRSLERRHNVRIHSIVDLDDIVRAMEKGIVGSAEQLEEVRRYREEYAGK